MKKTALDDNKQDDTMNLILSQRINFNSEFDLLEGEALAQKNM